MTGKEMQEIREKLGLPRKDFGLALGYTGDLQQIYKTIQRCEVGKRTISPRAEKRIEQISQYFDQTGQVLYFESFTDEIEKEKQ
jgi:DNA-binding transcriptional regulator YiaG